MTDKDLGNPSPAEAKARINSNIRAIWNALGLNDQEVLSGLDLICAQQALISVFVAVTLRESDEDFGVLLDVIRQGRLERRPADLSLIDADTPVEGTG